MLNVAWHVEQFLATFWTFIMISIIFRKPMSGAGPVKDVPARQFDSIVRLRPVGNPAISPFLIIGVVQGVCQLLRRDP